MAKRYSRARRRRRRSILVSPRSISARSARERYVVPSRGFGRLRLLPSLVRRIAGGVARRGGGRHRSERRRQNHTNASHLRPGAVARRRDDARRPFRRRPAGASRDRAGHSACARAPAAVSKAHRRGQSAHRRLHPAGAGALRRATRAGLRAVSPLERPAGSIRRHALGRRTADVRHRPRPDVAAEIAAHGRTFGRAGAARGRAGVRSGSPHSRRRPDRADRRAERAASARRGRPRLSAGGGQHQARGHFERSQGPRIHPQGVFGIVAAMDIYLLEAIINGILLGGVLALLALGLNLIFGVIDVVWIAYADLVMCGMYMVYWLYAGFGWPLLLACAVAIAGVAVLGVLVHVLIIAPILGSAPINQLLATGGLLYFLQSFATLVFGTDFRNIGVRLPIIEVGDLFISFARLIAFVVALIGAVALYFFLRRTYLGTAIRAIAQDRDIMGLMGVDQRRIYLVTSAIGGALAGLGACLLALQYDVHPFIGNTFGPLIFMICVLGGLGNMIGGFIAAFIISQIIAIGGYYFSTELSYVLAYTLFIALMFLRPRGILAR